WSVSCTKHIWKSSNFAREHLRPAKTPHELKERSRLSEGLPTPVRDFAAIELDVVRIGITSGLDMIPELAAGQTTALILVFKSSDELDGPMVARFRVFPFAGGTDRQRL